MRLFAFLFASAVPTVALADSPIRVYAIVVGVDSPPPRASLSPLRFADDDAARYFELLSLYADQTVLLTTLDADSQRQHVGLAEQAVPPTPERLAGAVARIREAVSLDRAANRRTELLFLYAGHGFVDDAGEPSLALEGGALGREALARDVVASIGADRTHVILDACHAGDVVGARGDWQDDTAPVDHADLVRAYVAGGRIDAQSTVGYVVSGSADQETHEWSEYRAGVFSHEVVSGLLGAADVDGDGRIEYSELGAFLASANASVDDPRARLAVRVRPPPADRRSAILDLARARAPHVLSLGAGASGRFHLEDARGVRYADFHKEAGSEMAIALGPAAFYYLRGERGEARIDPGRARVVRAAGLSWRAPEMRSRGAVSESFRRGLFATAFGPSFYEGHAAATGEIPVGPATHRWVEPSLRETEPGAVPARPDRSPAHESSALRSWGWASLGTAAAVGIGAGVLGYLTLDAQSSFEDDVRSEGVADERLEETVRDRGTATTVLIGASVGAAALGATLLLLSGGEEDSAHVSVGPTEGGAAVSVDGSL